MNFKQCQELYQFNNARRAVLYAEAAKQGSPEQQIKFVADYFTNNLPIDVIAKIDGVSEEEVLPFKYDYSFLEDVKSDLNRLQESRRYDAHRSAVTLKSVDDDRRGSEHINVYPTIYALKMATCKMFASEIQRFAHDFGIESQMVEKFTWCYDHFDGLSTTRQPIKTDRIINMYHYYNVLTINGKPLKLDIAGVLTSQDFNKDHSSIAIDPNDFYFSEDLTKNPFEERESIYLIPYNVPRQPGM